MVSYYNSKLIIIVVGPLAFSSLICCFEYQTSKTPIKFSTFSNFFHSYPLDYKSCNYLKVVVHFCIKLINCKVFDFIF